VNDLLSGIRLDSISGAWLAQLLETATAAFVAFSLVLSRLSGMVLVGPIFGHPDIPLQIRAFLVLALSLVITPALIGIDRQAAFDRLDRNGNALIEFDEVPPALKSHFEQLLGRAGKADSDSLEQHEFSPPALMPHSAIEYAGLSAMEFAVGAALGLGVMTFVSGLQMAGNLIDQQIGVSLGEVFNPEFEVNATLSGQTLHQLGTIVFLVVGGHLLMLSAFVDTFQALPVGYARVDEPVIELLSALVQQSLGLALRVSAPIMASMTVVSLALGLLGHSIPQINVLVMGFPVRAAVGLIVLGLAFSGIGEVMAEVFPSVIESLRNLLAVF
jgi:flagellar biosynthesis protein FliR